MTATPPDECWLVRLLLAKFQPQVSEVSQTFSPSLDNWVSSNKDPWQENFRQNRANSE